MSATDKAIRKRTQIANTNRAMFVWIAGASVVFGVSLVAVIFLFQMMLFNERVIAEKNNTVSVLEHNNSVISALQDEIRKLNTDQALIDSKARPDDKAIQAILDALPSDANSLALGASLQNKLLSGIDGLKLESLQVEPVAGIEVIEGEDVVVDASGEQPSGNEIRFTFSVNGKANVLKEALLNLEKSIRTIDIISLKIESQGSAQLMTVQGRAYYEPARVVELKDKTVK